jgi:hypothetical protein
MERGRAREVVASTLVVAKVDLPFFVVRARSGSPRDFGEHK